MIIKGTDISVYQTVDFSKLKVSTDFCIMKATEGWGFTDKKFLIHQKGARDAGMLVGYYCFTRPDLGNTVEAEVDYLLKTIGTLKAGEIIFLDYEVSYAKPVAWCKEWLDYLAKKLGGYKGLVYLNQSLLNGNDWSSVIAAGYGLWLAKYDYVFPSEMPQTKWGTCAFQQYSNREVVSGISSPVDANAFFGDKTQYKKYGYSITTTTPPTTPPSCEEQLKGLEVQIGHLQDEVVLVTGERDKAIREYGEYQDRTTKQLSEKQAQIESLQKTNVELTAQIGLLGDQVKVAIEERKTAVEVAQKLTEENKVLLDNAVLLQAEVDRLNEKLKAKLKGYTKGELFRAYFGRYPDKY